MLNKPVPLGRMLYAVALVGLDIELLLTHIFPAGLFPLPAAFPGRLVLVISLGIGLTLAGLSMLTGRKADSAALLLGILWLLVAFTLHLPNLVRTPQNGSTWTVIFELVALSGGAFYVAGEVALAGSTTSRWYNGMTVGRLLFGVSLIVFYVLHFIYAAFIATLIPTWIPGRLFWTYFVGVAFVAAGLSLFIRRQVSLAMNLLGLMFLLWVVGLHAPRVVASPRIEPEWTSLLIALAMSGISFTIGRVASQKAEVFG